MLEAISAWGFVIPENVTPPWHLLSESPDPAEGFELFRRRDYPDTPSELIQFKDGSWVLVESSTLLPLDESPVTLEMDMMPSLEFSWMVEELFATTPGWVVGYRARS